MLEIDQFKALKLGQEQERREDSSPQECQYNSLPEENELKSSKNNDSLQIILSVAVGVFIAILFSFFEYLIL